MVEVTVELVLTALQTISIMIGIIYYILTLRTNQKNQQLALETRQAQLFMQVYNRWTDQEFNENYLSIINREYRHFDEWIEKYGQKNNPKGTARARTVGQYFEGIGILVKRGLIDPALVDDMMSGLVLTWWDKVKSRVYSGRERWNAPQTLEWSEYLANEIRSIAERQHPELKT